MTPFAKIFDKSAMFDMVERRLRLYYVSAVFPIARDWALWRPEGKPIVGRPTNYLGQGQGQGQGLLEGSLWHCRTNNALGTREVHASRAGEPSGGLRGVYHDSFTRHPAHVRFPVRISQASTLTISWRMSCHTKISIHTTLKIFSMVMTTKTGKAGIAWWR